jgi:hypothetical protein
MSEAGYTEAVVLRGLEIMPNVRTDTAANTISVGWSKPHEAR